MCFIYSDKGDKAEVKYRGNIVQFLELFLCETDSGCFGAKVSFSKTDEHSSYIPKEIIYYRDEYIELEYQI